MRYLNNFLDSRAVPLLCDPMQKTSGLCVLGGPQGYWQQSQPHVVCSWFHGCPGERNIQHSACCPSSLVAPGVRCSQTVVLQRRSSLGPTRILLKRKVRGKQPCVLFTTDQVLTDLFVCVWVCTRISLFSPGWSQSCYLPAKVL